MSTTAEDLKLMKEWCESHPVHVRYLARQLEPSLEDVLAFTFYDVVIKSGNIYLIIKEENKDSLFPNWRHIIPVPHKVYLSWNWSKYATSETRINIDKSLIIRDILEAKNQ